MAMQINLDNDRDVTIKFLKNSFEQIYLLELSTGKFTEYSVEQFLPLHSMNYHDFLIALARDMYKSETADFFKQMETSAICTYLNRTQKLYTVYFRLLSGSACREFELGMFYFDEDRQIIAITRKELSHDRPRPLETCSELAFANDRLSFMVNHVVENFIEIEVTTGKCYMLHGDDGVRSFETLKEQIEWWAENLIVPEEREKYIEEFELSNLLHTLRDNNGCHSSTYTTNQEDGCHSLSIECMLFKRRHGNQEEYIFAYTMDVSQFKEQESRNKQLVDISQQLLTLSQTEPVTGLFNRTAAEKFIIEYIENSRQIYAGTLLLLDIDRFKDFNDRYGHQVGDYVLKYLSKSMQDIFRSDDILCRWGGDEFMIFMRDVYKKNNVESRIERLRMRMQQCKRNQDELIVTVSIGGTVVKRGTDMKELFARCDAMLYKVKEQGRDGLIIYDES